MPTRDKRILLTKLELEVMRPVWEARPVALTAREVVDRLNAGRDKPLAYTTVQTVLKILEDKRVVVSEPGPGRAHQFAPRVTREQVSTSMIGDLVDRLFDGEVEPLLVHLVGNEKLSRDELVKLRAMIETQLDDDEAGEGKAR
jgi:BlaI family transcriptional regulator, penicillinase repressor